jgi:hypothetical protein
MLSRYNLKIINGKINELIYDKNNIYKIPNYCINLPYLEIKVKEKEQEHNKKKFNLFFHNVYENKNINIEILDNLKIFDVKIKYLEFISNDYIDIKLRFLYGGCELIDENFLYHYNINNDNII